MAREIDVDELVLLREQGHPIIDVREPDEYAAAHVPGVRLIPLATVPDEADSLPAMRPCTSSATQGPAASGRPTTF